MPLLFLLTFRGRRCLFLFNGIFFKSKILNKIIILWIDYNVGIRLEKKWKLKKVSDFNVTLRSELPPVCSSIYIHFFFKNSLYYSRKVRKNRCHILSHGQLARNSQKIAWAGQKVTKSIPGEPMVIETWLTLQNDCKTQFSGSTQANYTPTKVVFNQKCPQNDFFIFGDITW